MNIIDIICLSLLGLSAVAGLVRGFTREVLGIAAWIGAVSAAYFGAPYLKPYFEPLIQRKVFLDPACLITGFIGSLIVLSFIFRTISRTIRGSVLGGVDRSLGLFFGLTRGLVVLLCAYVLVLFFLPVTKQPDAMRSALITKVMDISLTELEHHTSDWVIWSRLKTARHENAQPDTAVDEPAHHADGTPDLAADARKHFKNNPQAAEASSSAPVHKLVETLSYLRAQSTKPAQDAPQGYNQKQRQDMNRLMHSRSTTAEEPAPAHTPAPVDQPTAAAGDASPPSELESA